MTTSVNMASDDSPSTRPSLTQKQKSVTYLEEAASNNSHSNNKSSTHHKSLQQEEDEEEDVAVAIVSELRETMHQQNEKLGHYNTFIKRLLIVTCTSCVLLWALFLGLEYRASTVTAPTAPTRYVMVPAAAAADDVAADHLVLLQPIELQQYEQQQQHEEPSQHESRELQGGGGGGCVGCMQNGEETEWMACFDPVTEMATTVNVLYLNNDYGCGCQVVGTFDLCSYAGLVCGPAATALCEA